MYKLMQGHYFWRQKNFFMKFPKYLICAAAVLPLISAACNRMPAELVNTLQGSASVPEFSTGNTYPAVAVPWGMNFWTPQTGKNGNGWQYSYSDSSIIGFKQTHQPSPWINDYGCYSVMPVYDGCSPERRATAFSHSNESAKPYRYDVTFDNGISTSMTATNSGAVFRFRYTESGGSCIIVDCFNAEGAIEADLEHNIIRGRSSYYAPNNKAALPENFATHFIMTFDKPIKSIRIMQKGKELDGRISASGKMLTACISFGQEKEVIMKTASSFINNAQAEINMEREIGRKSFRRISDEGRRIWNREMSRISVSGSTEEQLRTFYTALYRTMLFPRKTHEYDADGRQIHYSFHTGKTEQGPMYADNGFWDTFRAVHPFFTIMHPSLSGEFMDAMINIYEEGGWLPEWFSPGYKDCMIGQNSTSVITDAKAKGIGDYDSRLMFSAMSKGASGRGPNATGRTGYQDYDRIGYVPCDAGIKGNVSRTLEYAYNDWCMAEYAKITGMPEDTVRRYRERALNYRNIIDATCGFARPKDSSGNWKEDFTPDSWSYDFVEGCSWHWTWSVFHDPEGLIRIMGGDSSFVRKLDSVFEAAPTVTLDPGRRVIHEMREMVAGDMGQYAHGNQPIQHMAYLYNYAGAPYKTQKYIDLISRKLYSSGTQDGTGLCGDEDNGQTSAWYVFSSLGFYPVCPGTGEYIIGKPMFAKASLELENGKTFNIVAKNISDKNIYIQSAELNGIPFNNSYLTHRQITEGGTLTFIMGDRPEKSWAAESRPYSLTKDN